jgi:hypothetical protein
LVVSAAFKEEPHQQGPARSEDAPIATAARIGPPPSQPPSSLAPGRSRSRRHQQPRPDSRVAGEARKAPPQAR